MSPDQSKELESLQGTPAAAALRSILWEARQNFMGELLAGPEKTSERQRDYAAGAVTAVEDVYGQLRDVLKWGKPAAFRIPDREFVGPQGPQGPQGPH